MQPQGLKAVCTDKFNQLTQDGVQGSHDSGLMGLPKFNFTLKCTFWAFCLDPAAMPRYWNIHLVQFRDERDSLDVAIFVAF